MPIIRLWKNLKKNTNFLYFGGGQLRLVQMALTMQMHSLGLTATGKRLVEPQNVLRNMFWNQQVQ